MSDLDALLAGIVADPTDALRWLVTADWLEDHGQPERAELVRVHRELLRTCTATRETKARKQLHARMMELMRAGVQPCLPQRTITLPGGVEMRFSLIPPGSFLMGSPKSEQIRGFEAQLRRATVKQGFWLGQTPVTQRQWVALEAKNPSSFSGHELPVETVSWDDVQAYCEAVNTQLGMKLRLPTELEWEYAARAGTTTPFYWGAELDGTQANCDGDSPDGTDSNGPFLGRTSSVGSYASISPHPWGLADVVGNVWELCSDVYNVAENAGSCRGRRGGSWDYPAGYCRSAFRNWCGIDERENYIGFRLAADLSALA